MALLSTVLASTSVAAEPHPCSSAELGALFAAHRPVAVELEGADSPTRFTIHARAERHRGVVELRSERGGMALELQPRADALPDFAKLPSFRVVLSGEATGLSPTEQGRVARAVLERAQQADQGGCVFVAALPAPVTAAAAEGQDRPIAPPPVPTRDAAEGQLAVGPWLLGLLGIALAIGLLIRLSRGLDRRSRVVGASAALVCAAAWWAADAGLPDPAPWDCHEPDPALGPDCWRLRPSCASRWEGFARRGPGAPFSVNADGHRGPRALRERPSGGLRIAVFGASVLAGYGVGDGQTWRAHTEAALRAALPGRAVEVLNFAVAGDDLSKQLLRADRRAALAPDLYVFAADRSLLHPTECGPWWEANHGAARWLPPLRRHRLGALGSRVADAAETEASMAALERFATAHPEARTMLWSLGSIAPDDASAAALRARLRARRVEVLEGRGLIEALDTDPEAALANREGYGARGHQRLGEALAAGLLERGGWQ